MTGVQPRPLRYRGRLNRRGAKARKLRFRLLRVYGRATAAPGERIERGDALVLGTDGYVRRAAPVDVHAAASRLRSWMDGDGLLPADAGLPWSSRAGGER